MASDSDSATTFNDSTDQNANPNPNLPETTQDRMRILTLGDSDDVFDVEHASNQQSLCEVENGSSVAARDRGDVPEMEQQILGCPTPISAVSESGENVGDCSSAVLVWRDNLELVGDGPSSPTSSGYAGETGSGSVTSASAIEEVDGDEIDEAVVLQDGSFDASSDSVSRVPGKRNMDEVGGVLSYFTFPVCSLQYSTTPARPHPKKRKGKKVCHIIWFAILYTFMVLGGIR